jgi:hypothetical protein
MVSPFVVAGGLAWWLWQAKKKNNREDSES